MSKEMYKEMLQVTLVVLVAVALVMHGSATKLQTARKIGTSGGASGTATAFDGSKDITIPISSINPDYLGKVVPVGKGGTGNTTGNAATATKLQTKRNIGINGGITGTATGFDGTANINIPVTSINPDYLSKVVPVSKGGTGLNSITPTKINCTKASGVQDDLFIMYSPIAKICILNFDVTTQLYDSTTKTIGTVPSGYRPKFIVQGSTEYGSIEVDTSGNIKLTVHDGPYVFAHGQVAWMLT